jgi:plasmid stability protein
MAMMVQIRNVPDALHRKLKARAAVAGMSLSEFILNELKRSLERPTRAEFLEHLAARTTVEPKTRAADAVRAEREAR